MKNKSQIWIKIYFVCLLIGIFVSVRCQSSDHSKDAQLIGRSNLKIGIDEGTGLPEQIISNVGEQERSWLFAPVTLTVLNETSKNKEQVSKTNIRIKNDDVESSTDLELLGISEDEFMEIVSD